MSIIIIPAICRFVCAVSAISVDVVMLGLSAATTWSFLLVRKSCWRSFSRPSTGLCFLPRRSSGRTVTWKTSILMSGKGRGSSGLEACIPLVFSYYYSRALDVLLVLCRFGFMNVTNHYLHRFHMISVIGVLGRSFSGWKWIHNEYTTLNLLSWHKMSISFTAIIFFLLLLQNDEWWISVFCLFLNVFIQYMKVCDLIYYIFYHNCTIL